MVERHGLPEHRACSLELWNAFFGKSWESTHVQMLVEGHERRAVPVDDFKGCLPSLDEAPELTSFQYKFVEHASKAGKTAKEPQPSSAESASLPDTTAVGQQQSQHVRAADPKSPGATGSGARGGPPGLPGAVRRAKKDIENWDDLCYHKDVS